MSLYSYFRHLKMRLFYMRQYQKLVTLLLSFTCLILVMNTYYMYNPREHIASHSGETPRSRPSVPKKGTRSSPADRAKTDSGNVHLDAENMKINLFLVRKYLQAVNYSKSAGGSRLGIGNTHEPGVRPSSGGLGNARESGVSPQSGGLGEEGELSKVDLEKSRKILEENADTLVEIAGLLQGGHFSRVENSNSNRRNLPEESERESQIRAIKQHWQPFYVNFDSHHSQPNYNRTISYNRRKVAEWDLFSLDFPNEQSQDKVLANFQLPKSIFRHILRIVEKNQPGRVRNWNPPKKRKLFIYDDDNLQSWQKFHHHITQYNLYSPADPLFNTVLQELQTMAFTNLHQPTGGTQQKLVFTLRNGLRLIFKPMRFPRKQEALPDHVFWRDYERHFAEIAAFHLDMALQFYRVPPVVGRYVNVTSDIRQLDDRKLLTYFRSPAGNLCFYGKCDYYCDTAHAVCGRPEIMEGSFMMYLPTSSLVGRVNWENPWKRTYSKTHPKAVWQSDREYCDAVRAEPPYSSGRRLLDLMDISVFDFIAGNMDRHHYETIEEFGNDSFPVLFDNGRGFGKSGHDELTILAPIYQCCLIRHSTLTKLISFHKGPKHLSHVMRESLRHDLAHPVLLEPHLAAIDRRLQMILRTVYKCIIEKGYSTVVLYDGL